MIHEASKSNDCTKNLFYNFIRHEQWLHSSSSTAAIVLEPGNIKYKVSPTSVSQINVSLKHSLAVFLEWKVFLKH